MLQSRYLEGKVCDDSSGAQCSLSISDHNESVLATLQQSRRCHCVWTSACVGEEGVYSEVTKHWETTCLFTTQIYFRNTRGQGIITILYMYVHISHVFTFERD